MSKTKKNSVPPKGSPEWVSLKTALQAFVWAASDMEEVLGHTMHSAEILRRYASPLTMAGLRAAMKALDQSYQVEYEALTGLHPTRIQ